MSTTAHLSIPFGIIVGLLASFVQSLGLTIQRKSHVQNQLLPEHKQRVEHRRPLWLLGFAIFISSNILGSLVQIASLPVVILAPLGAVSLLWNAFFARLLLGDIFSLWMILGTVFISGGAVLIAIFGIVPDQRRSLEDLLQLFRRPTFVAYFSVLGFLVFVCLVITHVCEFSLSRRLQKEVSSSDNLSALSLDLNPSTQSANLTTGITDTTNNSLPTERTPLLDSKYKDISPSPHTRRCEDLEPRSITRIRLLLAISYASFSGIISGMCLLFAKSGVELLLLSIGGNNQFWRWESWALLIGLVVFALLQLLYLHKALILADPTLVCPSAFCFYNLSSIVNGLVYFNQFTLIPPLHLSLVAIGIVILLGGVWIVSIQAGGGGVDVGTWNEEDIRLTSADDALYPDQVENVTPSLEQTLQLPISPPESQSRFGPVPMERETRSESNLPNFSQSPSLGLGLRPEGDNTLPQSYGQSSVCPNHRRRAETQLYPSPRSPLDLSRRAAMRPIAAQPPSSTLVARHRTVSHPLGHAHGQVSAPISTVSAGFQIGLSPVSPGFTIMPLERGRRPSIIGRPSFANVVTEVMNRQRRRTVSEGELMSGTREEPESYATTDEHGLMDGLEDPSGVGEDLDQITSPGQHRDRWKWIRNVFIAKD